MKEFRFEYKVLGRKRAYTVKLPESLAEATPGQFVHLAGFYSLVADQIRERILIGLKVYELPKKVMKALEADQIANLMGQLHLIDSQSLVNRWFVPKFAGFYGPSDGFNNLTFGEFCFADTLFLAYSKKPDKDLLCQLIACLYRPAYHKSGKDVDFRGDVRQEFNPNRVESLAKAVKVFPAELLTAIFFNYMLVRRWIEAEYPKVFPEAEAENKPEQTASGWSMVIRAMAPTLLDVEKVENLNLHLVLTDMNEKIGKA